MDVPGYALVTGAGSHFGIGTACAIAFAQEGVAGVALLDINGEGLEATEAEIAKIVRSTPCKVLTYTINITSEADVIHAVNDAAQKFGRLDYAINAAGIALKHAGGTAYATTDDWNRVLDINLNGTFYVLRAAAAIMLSQSPILSDIDGRPLQRGSIVNFSSIQGVVGITMSTAYTTAKHAVIGLTRTASEDYAARGLRVNAICPGYTETPMTMGNPEVLRAMEERIESAVPMGRMGRPQEIADGVLYLAGGRSSFVTGSALMVDGGYTSR